MSVIRYEGLYVNELIEQFDYVTYCCLTGETPHANGEHTYWTYALSLASRCPRWMAAASYSVNNSFC